MPWRNPNEGAFTVSLPAGWQIQGGTVRDDLGRCQTVDADVDKYYSDCSGTMYAGTASGDPPPSSLSACWNPTH